MDESESNRDLQLYDFYKDRSTPESEASPLLPAWTVKVHTAMTNDHAFVFFDKTARIELSGKVILFINWFIICRWWTLRIGFSGSERRLRLRQRKKSKNFLGMISRISTDMTRSCTLHSILHELIFSDYVQLPEVCDTNAKFKVLETTSLWGLKFPRSQDMELDPKEVTLQVVPGEKQAIVPTGKAPVGEESA